MHERALIDYHIHSNFSGDSKSKVYEICQKAIDFEMREIGFADRIDFEPKDWGYKLFDYNKYTSEINDAHTAFSGHRESISGPSPRK